MRHQRKEQPWQKRPPGENLLVVRCASTFASTHPPRAITTRSASSIPALLRGRTPRFGGFPKVQAYRGPLPDGTAGIEFTTDTPPDPQSPPGQASWSGPRPGVTLFTDENGVDWAQIEVTVTNIRWKETR
jgi:hypothetical protein